MRLLLALCALACAVPAMAGVVTLPLPATAAWTSESNQPLAHHGQTVATAGDVDNDGFSDVLVAAPDFDNGNLNEGRVSLYRGSASGPLAVAAWTFEADRDSAGAGSSVSAAGDVNGDGYGDVIVGARTWSNGESEEGKAWLFLGSASGLSVAAAWSVESNQALAHYGSAVAFAGDINGDGYGDVIVGAQGYANGEVREGVAYVYLGSAGGLATSPAWTVEGNKAGAHFGDAVASAGDVNGDGYADVIVGAPDYDGPPNGSGRATVYLGSAGGLATSPVWTVTGTQLTEAFGTTVGAVGDVNGDGYSDVFVGAPSYTGDLSAEGAVFVYHGGASGPALTASWTQEGNQASCQFGFAASSAGDVNGDGFADLLVGANRFDDPDDSEGKAALYLGTATGLSATHFVWTAESNQALARFGFSVSGAGDVNNDGFSDALIGASNYSAGQNNEGRAFVFLGRASACDTLAGWSATGTDAFGVFGTSVASNGDINADGYDDLLVGEPGYDVSPALGGRLQVFLGSSAGPAATASTIIGNTLASQQFATAVSFAGDVNGDGYDDVVVGDDAWTSNTIVMARATLYLGGASGLSTTPAWTYDMGAPSAYSSCVAGAGDVNGDGFADVIVGSPLYDNGQTNEGHLWLFLGSGTGLGTSPAWDYEPNVTGATFGTRLTHGDVNGDGFEDLVVGSPGSGSDIGRVWVFHGGATGLSATPSTTLDGPAFTSVFGLGLAAEDVDGDALCDILVGAAGYPGSFPPAGTVYIYRGRFTGVSPTPSWTHAGWANSEFGLSVAALGDVNGDGFGDFACSAPWFGASGAYQGRVGVYFGSATLADTTAYTIIDHTADPLAYWPGILAGPGDLNGDGFGDLVLADKEDDTGGSGAGRVSIYWGNAGDGVSRKRPQLTASFVPIALGGKTPSASTFQVLHERRTAVGRGMVRGQYEIKPRRSPFTGNAILYGSWARTSAPGSSGSANTLATLFGFLWGGDVWHWRMRAITDWPYAPTTPWVTPGGNSPQEGDIRTSGPTAISADDHDTPAAAWVRMTPHSAVPALEFAVPRAGMATLRLYDIRGRLARHIVREAPAGVSRVPLDAAMTRGVYGAVLECSGASWRGTVAILP